MASVGLESITLEGKTNSLQLTDIYQRGSAMRELSYRPDFFFFYRTWALLEAQCESSEASRKTHTMKKTMCGFQRFPALK